MNADSARITTVQLRMALSCILLAVLGGAFSVLHYIPAASERLNALGLTLPRLRPVHTTFATLWIYGAAVAVVYDFFARGKGGLDRGDLARFKFHTLCWIAAGAGIFVSLLAGVSSGREYLEFHPAFSIPLLLGWAAFGWSFLKRAFRGGFWAQPVYVYMWTVGVLLFMYAFVEAHAWLLAPVREHPLRDLQLQWKSCGTLVGSFNFMVYGSLAYARERITGDSGPAQSRLSFALFGVGCLNSFTNYVHHTYHLPQDHAQKWIAFVVSMAEIVIFWYVFKDVVKAMREKTPDHPALRFFVSGRTWTATMLALSMAISIPPINALIHGTYVVTAHAMGTEIGIDSMVLFGALSYLLVEMHRTRPAVMARLTSPTLSLHLRLLNVAAAILVIWLGSAGFAHGWNRNNGEPTPAWVAWGTYVFPFAGALVATMLLALVFRWLPMLRGARVAEPVLAVPEPGA